MRAKLQSSWLRLIIAFRAWQYRKTLRKMNKILCSHGVVVTAPETVMEAWDRTFPEPALETETVTVSA